MSELNCTAVKDGVYQFPCNALDDEEEAILIEAASKGLICLSEEYFLGDYHILTLTDEGRREFGIHKADYIEVWAKIIDNLRVRGLGLIANVPWR